MKEKRSKRIQLVVDLACRAESQAARNLSEAQNIEAAELRRLEEVKAYYDSYDTQFAQNTHNITASDLARSRGFLVNLDQACKAQKVQLQKAQSQVDIARHQWRQSHLKSDSLKSYKVKCSQEEQLLEDKQEQKYLDELVTQKYSHKLL